MRVKPLRNLKLAQMLVRSTLVVAVLTLAFTFDPQSALAVKKKTPTKQTTVRKLKIRAGDSLYLILKKNGFNQALMSQILPNNVMPKGYDLMVGEVYRVFHDKVNETVILEFFDRDRDYIYKYWRRGKKVAGSEKNIREYTKKTITAQGTVNGSLIGSINQQIPDKLLPYHFMDAYVFDHNLKRVLQKGAKFSLTVEKKFDGGEFIKYGQILKTELEINGKNVVRHFVPFEDGGSFVDAKTNQNNRPFYSPVKYSHITSVFQRTRFHPIKKRRVAHLGIDYALPEGEDVYTAYAGHVIKSGKNRAAGRYVVIKHPNGMVSYYNHLSKTRSHIRPGTYVSNGEVIGKVGCTGYCTRPHLHFAVKKAGRFIDPLPYVKSYPYRSRQIVRQHIAKLKKKN